MEFQILLPFLVRTLYMSQSSRRSDSRSRESVRDWRSGSQRDRDDRRKRNRSHSRSSSPQHSAHHSHTNRRANDGSYSTREIQDIVDRKVAEDIKITAEKRVSEYIKSEDFGLMVESFKRREREKVMLEVQRELEKERELLLSEGRKSLASRVCTADDTDKSCVVATGDCEEFLSTEARADAILLQNKLKMEEEQRRVYNERQKEEAERLAEVLGRKRLEVSPSIFGSSMFASYDFSLLTDDDQDLIEQQRIESMQRHNEDLEHALNLPSSTHSVDEGSEQGHNAEAPSLPKSNSR